jgi:hypothetical protein
VIFFIYIRVHINLREIAEILQLMILYFYNMEGVEGENLVTSEEFLDLVKLFQASGFTKKTVSQTKAVEIDRVGFCIFVV